MPTALSSKLCLDTPLQDCVLAAGVDFAVATNYRPALDAVRASFPPSEAGLPRPKLRLQFWVDQRARGDSDWANPFLRGLGHLVVAEFDDENSLLIDLRGVRALGRFSPGPATDRVFWQRMIFPLLLGVAGATVGVTALQCACVVRQGRGLLLAGESGTGKSTLALALVRRGLAFVSDEWVYLSRSDGRLLAWGLPTPLELLPDTVTFFPELAAMEPAEALNGELAFEVDPGQVFGVRRAHHCEPHWLVLLERRPENGHAFEVVSPEEVAAHLEKDLLPEEPSAIRAQRDAIGMLVAGQCARFRYGGNPQAAAEALERYCELRSALPAGW
jgi:hypothetical protein